MQCGNFRYLEKNAAEQNFSLAYGIKFISNSCV